MKTISNEELTGALNALGVRFFQSDGDSPKLGKVRPTELLAALAANNEARLRLALIPLFLDCPEFSDAVIPAAHSLDGNALLTLQCYYTAAVWISRTAKPRTILLPDLFSRELGLVPAADPNDNLKNLADRQRELSGNSVNWLGTYRHAARWWKNIGGQPIQDAG